MIILTIKTDNPLSELGVYDNQQQLKYIIWHAHRELAETIHKKIFLLLNQAGKSIDDLEGIICFKGPGSFTGLRIGFSVANTLAYSQNIPIVARAGKSWIEEGIKDVNDGQDEKIITPNYGAAPKTTKPRK